jgi:catechol-2,3-dioxygenase
MAGIGRLSAIALDCREPRRLAEFYSAITGFAIDPDEDEEWVQLLGDGGPVLAFQLAAGHQPPVWPSDEHPQQRSASSSTNR